MKMRTLGLLLMLVVGAACTDDTAGVASSNNPTPDTGNNSEPDTSMPDMGEELGQTGDACETGAECESGICLNGLCAEECTGDADCPLGQSCKTVEIPLEGGGTQSVMACVQDVPCTANGDCADPDVCVVDRAGTEIELTCDTPAGPGDIGDACAGDAECASGLCLDGACSAPCDTANDCAGNGEFVCEIQSVPTDLGGPQDLTVCAPRPADICLSDSECTGTDRCVASKSATELTFECGPAVGAGESGDACAADGDCAQNLCVDGQCAGPCESVGDCGGAPNRCEVTNVDLGTGAMDSAQICLPPISCDNQADCPVAGNTVCYVREAGGAIDPICRAGNVGGGSLGQVCVSAQECANNYCLETRFRDVCATPCETAADCPLAGYECGTVAVELSGGGTQDVSMCVPSTPPACSSNMDCGTGRTCAIIENAAGNALESVCVPSTGGAGTGAACMADDDCASLVCLGGFCASPCTDSVQCGTNQLCLDQTVTKAPLSGNFDVCSTLQDTQCTSTDDCADGTRVCGDIRTNATTMAQEGFCTFPNVGQQQLGTACTQDSQCREDICLAGLSDECSVICDKDSDCAATQGCTTFGDLNFCNTTCQDNADCGSRYCSINGDDLTDQVDQICIAAVGAGDIGADCATGAECLTGLCLNTWIYNGTTCTDDAQCAGFAGHTCECPIDQPNCTTGKECAVAERRCTALCDDDGDCTGPVGNTMTDCAANIFVQRPSGASTNISACAQP